MIIIGVKKEDQDRFVIGKTCSGKVSDTKGEFHSVTFYVVREATLDEYIDCVMEAVGVPPMGKHTYDPGTKFYQISMD